MTGRAPRRQMLLRRSERRAAPATCPPAPYLRVSDPSSNAHRCLGERIEGKPKARTRDAIRAVRKRARAQVLELAVEISPDAAPRVRVTTTPQSWSGTRSRAHRPSRRPLSAVAGETLALRVSRDTNPRTLSASAACSVKSPSGSSCAKTPSSLLLRSSRNQTSRSSKTSGSSAPTASGSSAPTACLLTDVYLEPADQCERSTTRTPRRALDRAIRSAAPRGLR
jgi:hypothetical protein